MNMDEQTKQKPVEDVCPSKKGKLNLEGCAGETLSRRAAHQYWRSLEELAGAPEFQEMLHREFPKGASEWLDTVSRRGFLRLMGAVHGPCRHDWLYQSSA